MKNSFLSFVVLFLSFSFYAQILTPIAEFKFNESIHETYSGLIPDTTANSFYYDTDELNTPNAAVYITGSTMALYDPAFSQFGTGDFTMSLWFKRTASLWPTRWLIMKNSSTGYFRLRYNGFFDQMNFYFRPDMDSSEFTVGTASQTVGLDNWNLYTITVDRDDQMKMYLNGNAVFTKDISTVATHPADFLDGNFTIGSYDCALNDLLFFDKALDSNEVQSLYNHKLNIAEFQNEDFVVHPNPTSNVLKIKSNEIVNESYRLYSLTGKLVQKGEIINSEIALDGLSAGKYVLKILDKSFTIVIR